MTIKKTILTPLITLAIIISIPLLTIAVQKTQNYLSKASYKEADIVINVNNIIQPLPKNWRALAQGGEELSPNTFTAILPQLSALKPEYIRMDHIYDYYDVVNRNPDNSLNISFSKLDIVISDIIKSGALPYLSLSYMPLALSGDQTVTGTPRDWNEWLLLVQKTVEHYSGINGLNLPGVYYEVWNEPDLFGGWKIGGVKDYLTLYAYSARGARQAVNTNQFYFGGPATTSSYSGWNQSLLNYAYRNNLPLDFLSWHFYGKDLGRLNRQVDEIDALLSYYPGIGVQKIISEWGIDSEFNSAYNTSLGASFTLANIKNLNHRLDYAFIFEIKDGPIPAADYNNLSGRWGLISHENNGKILKPRYTALKMLASLYRNELQMLGVGSQVNGFATREGDNYRTLLYNLDFDNQRSELVPVRFIHLANGNYKVKQISLSTRLERSEDVTVTDGIINRSIILMPNDVAVIDIAKSAGIVRYGSGKTGQTIDRSLELSDASESPVYDLASDLLPNGLKISLFYKPHWSGGTVNDYKLFSLAGSGGQKVFGRFGKINNVASLIFGLSLGDNELRWTSIPVNNWQAESWHNLAFSINQNNLTVEVDGNANEIKPDIVLLPFNRLEFAPASGAIDELKVYSGEKVILDEGFNDK